MQVYINGKCTEYERRDLMRPDVKEQGLHPSGLCGFELNLKFLKAGNYDQVSVSVTSEDYTLPVVSRVNQVNTIAKS